MNRTSSACALPWKAAEVPLPSPSGGEGVRRTGLRRAEAAQAGEGERDRFKSQYMRKNEREF
jgi:hypothetical protein